jgi:hypothetical protein
MAKECSESMLIVEEFGLMVTARDYNKVEPCFQLDYEAWEADPFPLGPEVNIRTWFSPKLEMTSCVT